MKAPPASSKKTSTMSSDNFDIMNSPIMQFFNGLKLKSGEDSIELQYLEKMSENPERQDEIFEEMMAEVMKNPSKSYFESTLSSANDLQMMKEMFTSFPVPTSQQENQSQGSQAPETNDLQSKVAQVNVLCDQVQAESWKQNPSMLKVYIKEHNHTRKITSERSPWSTIEGL